MRVWGPRLLKNSVRSKSKQLDQGPAENRFLLGVAQERRVQDCIHTGRPVKGLVRSEDDLAGADFRDQVPQTLFGNNNGIDKNLALQVLARVFLVRTVGIIPHLAVHLKSSEIGRHVSAAMSRADFQAREAIQGSVKHHVGKEDSGFERISDDVPQVTFSFKSVGLDDILGRLRVHENDDAKFLRLGPERVKSGSRQILAHHMTADGGGHVMGEDLSGPRFDPFWAKAQELGVIVFMHPQSAENVVKPDGLKGKGDLGNIIGNPLETAVFLTHMMFDGTLDRFPGLKICAAHGGGYMPSYLGRFEVDCQVRNNANCANKKHPSEYLKSQVLVDSIVVSEEGLRHLVAEVGAGQVVFGTDEPFNWPTSVDTILNASFLSDAEKETILGGTLVKLLRL